MFTILSQTAQSCETLGVIAEFPRRKFLCKLKFCGWMKPESQKIFMHKFCSNRTFEIEFLKRLNFKLLTFSKLKILLKLKRMELTESDFNWNKLFKKNESFVQAERNLFWLKWKFRLGWITGIKPNLISLKLELSLTISSQSNWIIFLNWIFNFSKIIFFKCNSAQHQLCSIWGLV